MQLQSLLEASSLKQRAFQAQQDLIELLPPEFEVELQSVGPEKIELVVKHPKLNLPRRIGFWRDMADRYTITVGKNKPQDTSLHSAAYVLICNANYPDILSALKAMPSFKRGRYEWFDGGISVEPHRNSTSNCQPIILKNNYQVTTVPSSSFWTAAGLKEAVDHDQNRLSLIKSAVDLSAATEAEIIAVVQKLKAENKLKDYSEPRPL